MGNMFTFGKIKQILFSCRNLKLNLKGGFLALNQIFREDSQAFISKMFDSLFGKTTYIIRGKLEFWFSYIYEKLPP